MQHIKLEITDVTIDKPMQAIAFGFSDFLKLSKNVNLLIFVIQLKNKHTGDPYTQLMIKDIKLSER